MGWFGRRKLTPAPANAVVVEEDLVPTLVAQGETLQVAVNAALREHLETKAREVQTAEARGIPFWLRRDSESGDLEEELRDRVIHRRSAEDSAP
jgi:hypothetical protein